LAPIRASSLAAATPLLANPKIVTRMPWTFTVTYRNFNVLRLSNASSMAMIHSRTTTFGSSHPFISKW
jgi:hypothetical protein